MGAKRSVSERNDLEAIFRINCGRTDLILNCVKFYNHRCTAECTKVQFWNILLNKQNKIIIIKKGGWGSYLACILAARLYREFFR